MPVPIRELIPVPEKALALDEVIERWPTIRQSWLAHFDDCPLSSYFQMKSEQGWSTHPQASGTILHRALAECLREMRRQDSTFIPVGEGLAILEEALEQRGVPAIERVRVPLRDLPKLRTAMITFCSRNTFSVRNIVDIEKRLEATLTYVDDEGQIRERTITGTPDALIADPRREDGAIIPDWKSSWRPPPRRDEDDTDDPGLSYHGFFQQRLYGWLIFKNYPSVNAVTLREFYVRVTEARAATITREQLPQIEKQIADAVLDLDRALMSGPPAKLKLPEVAPWLPSPGYHCKNCPIAHRCPIDADVREHYGAVTTEKRAREAVAQLEVAEAVRVSRRKALTPYIEENGPVASKYSKGRRALGLKSQKNGRVLKFFTPEGADRAPARQPEDRSLEDALRKSVERARTEA